MTQLLRVMIGERDDEFVDIEVDPNDLDADAVQFNASVADIAVAPFSLADSIDRIVPALSAILGRIRKIDAKPESVEMQIGLKIGGETGLIFAKGTAEANFTLKVSWSRSDQ
jgi:hypothetical protein